MAYKQMVMELDKKIALVAHDHKKRDLVEWAKFNRDLLAHHRVFATGTTGLLLEKRLGFPIIKLQSGPLGGDQQIGAKIVDGEIDSPHLLLGSTLTATARSRRERVAAHGRGLEYPHCLRPSFGRLHDFVAVDGLALLTVGAGLRCPPFARDSGKGRTLCGDATESTGPV